MNSIEIHLKQKRLDTYESFKSTKKIYLDTLYWIKLRDAEKNSDSVYKELLYKIRELVNSNKCIIPVSEVIFWEVLKQNGFKLKESTHLIDELSKGISIISEDERRSLEFISFVRKSQGHVLYEKKELVWTKLSLDVLYPLMPQPEDFKLKISFINFLETISFSDIISILKEDDNYHPFNHKDNVEFLNWAKEKYKDQNKSFKQMFLSELGGLVDLHKNSLNQAMDQVFYWDCGRYPTDEEKANRNPNELKNFIYNAFRLNKVTTEFPSFSIMAYLFAAVRWNKTRKYSDGNDTFDFMHATAALPYFDFFFTENELHTIIRQIKLDVAYGCVVESDPKKVLELLHSI